MNDELFSNVFGNSLSVPASLVQANKLTFANIEKLVAFQLSSLQYYVDLGLARMKDAAEVSNFQDWQDFVNGQIEFAKVVNQKVVDDAKTLQAFGVGLQADFDKLIKETFQSVPEVVKESADKAVKETNKAVSEKIA